MRTRRILVVLPAALVAAVGAVLLASEGIHRASSTRGLGISPGRPDGTVGREAVVVLGFGNAGARANRVNRYRVRAALRSMDPRAASTVLVLCGGSVMGDEPEARILARYARELGYRGPVVLEEASRSTRENVANAIPLVEDADTIRIVSDPVHAEEARVHLRAARPDLADRLARGREYRFGEVTWMKPLAIAVALLRRAREASRDRPDD
ncbi:YdcF family protein [Clavibacter zhangzhiyongii]|uniref:YdcF family protein n=1 Tax=Clavibacter zhangzhiyongii TaxID=2768071 RepID=UPI00195D5F0E|nr:YdcF family protein [Clavibacter zhangzhiyongii]MBM7026464.1 YdcF family protein [Clavibacter zhangzhiyongii]